MGELCGILCAELNKQNFAHLDTTKSQQSAQSEILHSIMKILEKLKPPKHQPMNEYDDDDGGNNNKSYDNDINNSNNNNNNNYYYYYDYNNNNKKINTNSSISI
ncbi:hypothetical protein KIN20_026724 [Parelaphostrongylus tenuis]|uniref:Uncharacterized protein n=1 Tax=Parelaphostrongylus tenuis TaxID=148309 RepID=A0AAD5WD37_PARTN|nr:hypothetical protein KIN20_026724 [Parelaphostrongylus tenuis]